MKNMLFDTSMIGLKTGIVELYPHQESWKTNAECNIFLIKTILGNDCIDAQHIGSTSVKGICSKPIIDIAVAVKEWNVVFSHIDILEQNNIIYRKVEETGQLLFIKGDFNEDLKTHHIHIVKDDSPNWYNYLNFRDYLNCFPEKAKEYNNFKLFLANKYPRDRKAYTAGKAEFIAVILVDVHRWRTIDEKK